MAIDRKSVLDNAQKLTIKGRLEDALSEYQRVLAEAPYDETTLNALGDIYSRLKNIPEAIKCYKKLGDKYLEKGFAVKALAVYKRITKLDPASIENNLRLADIQAHQGFVNEAKMQYAAVAERCADTGMKDKAIDIVKKILDIDPNDLRHRVKLAEFLSERKRTEEAVKEYLDVGKRLFTRSAFDDAIKVLKKTVEIAPTNAQALSMLAEVYSEKGDHESAFALFNDILAKNPDNAEVLIQLGRAYIKIKDEKSAAEVLQKAKQIEPSRVEGLVELGRFYLNQGRADEAFELYRTSAEGLVEAGDVKGAARTLEEFSSNYAGNPRSFSLLATLYQKLGQTSQAMNAYDAQVQAHIELKQYKQAEKILEKLISRDPENSQHRERLNFVQARIKGAPMDIGTEDLEPTKKAVVQKTLSVAATMTTEEDNIMDAVTEADVFMKYGLIAKAIERLQSAKSNYPKNIEIRTRLLGIYNEQGNRARAVEECVELSKLFKELGDEDSALEIIEDAREIDPTHPLLKDIAVSQPTEVKAAKEEEEAEDEEEFEDSIDFEIEEDESQYATQALEEDDFETLQQQTPPPAAEKEPSLQESLEEADFYIAQGFNKEALALLKTLQKKYPDEQRIANKLAKLEPKKEAPPPKVEKTKPKKEAVSKPIAKIIRELDAVEEKSEEFFDLADELAEEEPPAEAPRAEKDGIEGLTELFDAFKRGVEQQIGKEDYETHYNLGIAYKEMGLTDEAIAEFQIAAKNPDKTRYMDCCSMLGVCFMEKGLPNIAANWYKKGLEVPDLGEEDYIGLRYDLAIALEANGEIESARKLFTEVYGMDAKYRDVAQKVKTLQHAAKKSK